MPDTPPTHADATTAVVDGSPLTVFGGCNYLALAHHPSVQDAARDAIGAFGLSTSASRTTTGDTSIHAALERELAAFIGQPAALLLPDGYTANLAACQALAASVSAAVIDERAHRSLFDAAAAARLPTLTYRHRDPSHARTVASAVGGDVAIITDSVFSAAGSLAPLPELTRVLPTPGSRLLIDDCHGFCVLAGGRGAAAHFGLDDPRLVITTTLAKGLGCHGGAVLGDEGLIRTARASATAFICTTPASPILAAAARRALELVASPESPLPGLARNIARMQALLASLGVELDQNPTPIFAFTLGGEPEMRSIAAKLRTAGVLAPLVSYPGGPGRLYFRLSVNATHTEQQFEQLGSALAAALGQQNPATFAGA